MFTGIIEELGTVRALIEQSTGARLIVACQAVLQDATEGASIAVNGTCLTAVDLAPDYFAADLAPETLARTNLGQLRSGSPVNLERPLRANARLDGHFGRPNGLPWMRSARIIGGCAFECRRISRDT
jgi:riboflavin synthase